MQCTAKSCGEVSPSSAQQAACGQAWQTYCWVSRRSMSALQGNALRPPAQPCAQVQRPGSRRPLNVAIVEEASTSGRQHDQVDSASNIRQQAQRRGAGQGSRRCGLRTWGGQRCQAIFTDTTRCTRLGFASQLLQGSAACGGAAHHHSCTRQPKLPVLQRPWKRVTSLTHTTSPFGGEAAMDTATGRVCVTSSTRWTRSSTGQMTAACWT